MPRAEWSAQLNRADCSHMGDADGLETNAERWRTKDGRTFIVPYLLDEDGERRLASFVLMKIINEIEA